MHVSYNAFFAWFLLVKEKLGEAMGCLSRAVQPYHATGGCAFELFAPFVA